MNNIDKLMDFINESPTAFHTVDSIKTILDKNNFDRLFENECWNIKKGGNYYVIRNDSSIIAFKVPENYKSGFMISAAHSDSPSFKLKNNPMINKKDSYILLNTEPYGGLIAYGWFDRPLSIAGRVLVKENDNIVSKLFKIDKDLMVIPSLAIHMNRSVNEGIKIDMQKDMLPLISQNKDFDIDNLIAEAVGCHRNEILGSDVFLYNRQRGTLTGEEGEFILSPRLDDLMCVFGCLEGFIAGRNEEKISVLSVFDNEEVGSGTLQGADSDFLKDVLGRISQKIGETAEEFLISMSNSFMVSADNAHASHPNHLECEDLTNSPIINKGIVIKFSANQKYCTDAFSKAVFEDTLNKAEVPFQYFHNKSGTPGGSTLGNISISQLSIRSIDIGLPQLAMHSPTEIAGTKDYDYLIKAMMEYYSV